MTGMRCTGASPAVECGKVATLVISGGAVVLLMCDEHGRHLAAAADARGRLRLSVRSLRRPVHPRRRPA